MAMTTAIFLYSRRLGLLFFVWCAAVISFPRVYAGYHYASDIFGGALLGVVVAVFVDTLLREHLVKILQYALTKHFLATNVVLILFLFQVATMFDDLRLSGSDLKGAIKHDYLTARELTLHINSPAMNDARPQLEMRHAN